MTNAIIRLDVGNLNIPTETIKARFASSFTAKLVNAPMEVSGLFLRIFKTDKESYFDCPASQDSNGDWSCYIIGTCFPAAGESFYEVHATDDVGNPTSLGSGKLIVQPFTAGNTPLPAGSVISVATLPDGTGALHQVVAVNIGTADKPDWSWQVRSVDGTAQ